MENDWKNLILNTTQDLLNKAGFEGAVKIIDDGFGGGSLWVVSIESENNLSVLIGKNGQNLNAFEHLVRLIFFHKNNSHEMKDLNFTIDINDYRKSRAKYVLDLAKSTANRVVNTLKAEALAPMSSYERRLVHTELASNKDIQTESIGEEPRRRIVIKPLII